MSDKDEIAEPACSSRQLSAETVFSEMSTIQDSPESRKRKVSKVKDRIGRYVPGQWAHTKSTDNNLIPCLNACLDWLPAEGVDSLVHDVESCGDDEALYYVFKTLASGLLQPMKALSTGASVTESPIIKHQRNADLVAANIPEPQSRTDEFRDKCLRRDGSRCVVTQRMDINLWKNINRPSEGEKNAANVWETLFRCFPSIRRIGMNARNINDASNGITLLDIIHKQFGKFRCAFEPTETPHVYNFKTYLDYPYKKVFFPQDQKVTMRKAEGGEDVKLPSPELLECHWRIAEILNASGMSEIIDRIIKDWEYIKEGDEGHGSLREDGKSNVSEILSAAFWAHGHWVKT
ncbi:predicted protein [Histoplasma mississippiense (nom. inval.)]|uniref:predicted protein n=1 Tax=Ajellomyces capsulatus (strain NAm1 / WU24) TaxID=2059318 RepID=UPI000157BA15|nr:predicted protein [Histoplasma mississippiense (nom. inval.)]EDN04047.1 predicted protein [Histoplasma mississippiense (nom. inval.)]